MIERINSILPDREPWFPGNKEIEHRIRGCIRRNAAAMTERTNRLELSGGGHIAQSGAPESLVLSVWLREKLDNLTFVINCNPQQLDRSVRGSGKITQELDSYFRRAGWNVIEVIRRHG